MDIKLQSLNSMKSALSAIERKDPISEVLLRSAITDLEADIAKPVEPVGAESRFTESSAWLRCSVEHHYLVIGKPSEWPGYETRLLYTTPQEPAAPQAITKALEDAATSLETISILAGRATYGNPPIESCMGEHIEVRAYAKARADVARQSLAAPVGAPSCP